VYPMLPVSLDCFCFGFRRPSSVCMNTRRRPFVVVNNCFPLNWQLFWKIMYLLKYNVKKFNTIKGVINELNTMNHCISLSIITSYFSNINPTVALDTVSSQNNRKLSMLYNQRGNLKV
jgi:hypothetical protein